MSTRNPGESVDLKPFFAHDGKTQFRLQVYPNGNREENREHISIILENISNKLVYCDYKVELSACRLSKSIVFRDEHRLFTKPSSWDSEWPCDGDKIFKHTTCKSWSDFDLDNMTIFCTISRLFTQIDERVQENSPKAPSFGLQNKLSSIESKISEMVQLNQELMIKLEEQKREKLKQNNIPAPECPVCFEPLSRSPRIAQCVLGHLLCWNCKQRPELEDCPSCRGPISGRAFGMENYLKTLFPPQGEFQFLADRAGQGAVVNVDDESRIGG